MSQSIRERYHDHFLEVEPTTLEFDDVASGANSFELTPSGMFPEDWKFGIVGNY